MLKSGPPPVNILGGIYSGSSSNIFAEVTKPAIAVTKAIASFISPFAIALIFGSGLFSCLLNSGTVTSLNKFKFLPPTKGTWSGIFTCCCLLKGFTIGENIGFVLKLPDLIFAGVLVKDINSLTNGYLFALLSAYFIALPNTPVVSMSWVKVANLACFFACSKNRFVNGSNSLSPFCAYHSRTALTCFLINPSISFLGNPCLFASIKAIYVTSAIKFGAWTAASVAVILRPENLIALPAVFILLAPKPLPSDLIANLFWYFLFPKFIKLSSICIDFLYAFLIKW